MPDLDELLRARLARPLDVVAPPLGDLHRRAARHRQRRLGVVAAGAVAGLALVVTGLVGPWAPGAAPDTAGYASGPDSAVLDSGTGRSGPWRVLVTRDDGWCLKQVSSPNERGACLPVTPGRLRSASEFPNWDGDTYVVVVAGSAPPGTARVEVSAGGSTAVATTAEVQERLFWSARVPPGEGETRIVAYDGSGKVLAEVVWPALSAPPTPGPPVAPTGSS